MTEHSQATAREFARGARLYFECALAADNEVGMWPGFELVAPFPVMVLVSHSIELSLKSFLLYQEVFTYEELGPNLGHDLEKAYQACLKFPSFPRLSDAQLVTLKNINFGHDGMVFRYGRLQKRHSKIAGELNTDGRKPGLPVFGPMSEVAEHCLEACSAPSREEMV